MEGQGASEGSRVPDPCPHCGAEGVGGEDGCNSLFQEVVGREFSQPELFQVHRMTVDSYSLQHPDQYMKSAKSAVAHLTAMSWALEGRDDPSIALALSRFLDGNPQFERPEPVPPPPERGRITILQIHGAEESAEHIGLVREWAREAWRAWSDHHDQAREWVREAKERAESRKRR